MNDLDLIDSGTSWVIRIRYFETLLNFRMEQVPLIVARQSISSRALHLQLLLVDSL